MMKYALLTATALGLLAALPTAAQVPEAGISALIPDRLPSHPNLTSGTFPVPDFTVDISSSPRLASGATLPIHGRLAINGSATLPGTVTFVSNTAQSLSDRTATLAVNKASGTPALIYALAIDNALTLASSMRTITGAYRVAPSPAATIAGTEGNFVGAM